MPTSAQYARYRADRTTIWVSKTAAAFLSRERENGHESVGTVLDRLLKEVKRARGGAKPAGKPAARKSVKPAAKKTVKKAAKKAAKKSGRR